MTAPRQLNIWYVSKAKLPSVPANLIQTMQMCQAFRKLGAKITLACSAQSNDSPQPKWDNYGISIPFPIKIILRYKFLGNRLLFSLSASLQALKDHPDFVYTRDLHTAFFCSLLGIPYFLEWHSLETSRYEKIWLKIISKFRTWFKFVFISNALKDDFFQEYGKLFSNNDSIVLHDGVDLARFEKILNYDTVRLAANFPLNRFIVGYVGHIYPGRGVKEVIVPLAKRLPEILFVVIGANSQDLQQLRQDAYNNKISNIDFRTFVPNIEVPSYLGCFDCLIAPYQRKIMVSGGRGDTSRWASPLKIFEYMAAEKPIVISDLPVFHEVLNDGNCFFCIPEDLQSWVNAINCLRSEPTTAYLKARQASSDVVAFSWESRAKSIIQLFFNKK